MTSEKFRHQLRQEVEQWQTEGLIDQELSSQLAHRYQFADLDTANRNRFVMILIGLGSILLGLAAITFVAANWQAWAREVKVVLLMSLFMGVNILGFNLWRGSQGRWQGRLGTGLLLLGALILGANLALMSQMFHQSGPLYKLFLIWAIGVLAMAYSLRLTTLGMLALILMGISYILGFFNVFSPWNGLGLEPAIAHTPLIVSLLFIPLAYWCRSRWLFGLATILIIISLGANLAYFIGNVRQLPLFTEGILSAIGCSLPPALLWAYRDSLWQWQMQENTVSFNPISRRIALVFLSLLFYIFSFNIWDSSLYPPTTGEITWGYWFNLLDVCFFGILTIWAWWRLGYERDNGMGWQIDLKSSVMATIIIISGCLVLWQIVVGELGVIGTFLFNALLFILAVGLIREALATGKRIGFWGGIILMVLQLFSRMLEYETGLLLKAIVLFLCGIGVIVAGLWFERYVRTLN